MSRGNRLFIYIAKWILEDVALELSVLLSRVAMGPKQVRGYQCGEGSTWENGPDAVFCLRVLLFSVPWVM